MVRLLTRGSGRSDDAVGRHDQRTRKSRCSSRTSVIQSSQFCSALSLEVVVWLPLLCPAYHSAISPKNWSYIYIYIYRGSYYTNLNYTLISDTISTLARQLAAIFIVLTQQKQATKQTNTHTPWLPRWPVV